jgi:hypothetical protein
MVPETTTDGERDGEQTDVQTTEYTTDFAAQAAREVADGYGSSRQVSAHRTSVHALFSNPDKEITAPESYTIERVTIENSNVLLSVWFYPESDR